MGKKKPELLKKQPDVVTRSTKHSQHAVENMAGLFAKEGTPKPSGPSEADLKVPHAKIGQLTLENDFLEGALSKAGLLSPKHD